MDATYKISEQDYVRAAQLGSTYTRRGTILFILVSVALAIIALWGPSSFRATMTGGLIGFILFLALHRFLLVPILAKRSFKKHRSIHGETRISVKEDGIEMIGDDWSGITKWDKILKWRQNKHLVIFYFSPQIYVIIPKSIENSSIIIPSLITALQTNVGNEI